MNYRILISVYISYLLQNPFFVKNMEYNIFIFKYFGYFAIQISITIKAKISSIAISKYMNNIEIFVNNTLNYAMYMNFVSWSFDPIVIFACQVLFILHLKDFRIFSVRFTIFCNFLLFFYFILVLLKRAIQIIWPISSFLEIFYIIYYQ